MVRLYPMQWGIGVIFDSAQAGTAFQLLRRDRLHIVDITFHFEMSEAHREQELFQKPDSGFLPQFSSPYFVDNNRSTIVPFFKLYHFFVFWVGRWKIRSCLSWVGCSICLAWCSFKSKMHNIPAFMMAIVSAHNHMKNSKVWHKKQHMRLD